jgi:hypothetical protein
MRLNLDDIYNQTKGITKSILNDPLKKPVTNVNNPFEVNIPGRELADLSNDGTIATDISGQTFTQPTTTRTTSTQPTSTTASTQPTSTSASAQTTSATPTQTPITSPNQIPFFANSKLGNLEYTKYLYESGLQNIFNEYQMQVQSLQQQEQQSLQSAYYLREISKKYLGEYASNVGVGDVSGNLIDIYSQYASNITNIETEFANLELNLNRQYMMQKMQTFNDILTTQYQITQEQFDQAAISVAETAFSDYDRDILGGLSYIDSQREVMGEDQYQAIRDSYYQANFQSVLDTISSDNGYFGFSNLETKELKTRDQYLEEAKQWIEEKDWIKIQEAIAIQDIIKENEGEVPFEEKIGVDPTILTDDPNITKESKVYDVKLPDGTTSRYAVIGVDIAEDDVADKNGVTASVLTKAFIDQTEKTAAEVSEGDIVRYQGFYIYQNGSWFRMVSIDSPDTIDYTNLNRNQLDTWNMNYEGTNLAGNITIDFNYGNKKLDAVTVQGKTYVEDASVEKYTDFLTGAIPGTTIPTQEVISYLNKTFGEGTAVTISGAPTQYIPYTDKTLPSTTQVLSEVPKGQIFYYKGQFFVYTADGKKIRPLVQETT